MGGANAGCHSMGMLEVTLVWFFRRRESALTLPPAPRACYKCNMRRWMRDRGKRRKQQPDKQGQDQPAPLQPRFPEPIPDDIGNRLDEPEYQAPAAAAESESDSPGSQPSAQTGGGGEPPQGFRRDRNRRRGRRGRGGRPPQQPATQAPSLPTPGGPTGEAAEADSSPEIAEPAAAAARPPADRKSVV